MTLVIGSISFEERCLALPKNLPFRFNDTNIMMLDFLGYENVGPYLQNRTKIWEQLKAKGYSPLAIEGAPSQSLDALQHIEMELEKYNPGSVILDISTLPRNYLFGICRLLAMRGVPTIIRYYKPLSYGTELSRGVGSVKAIPGFEGAAAPSGDVVLVIILGFEGYKALQAWERVAPTRVIALIGDPPYKPSFLDFSKKQNYELLSNLKDIEMESLHTSDVVQAKLQLQAIHDNVIKLKKDVSFVICPLGTKLQSLATFAFAHEHKDISVVYVTSLQYFSEKYSTGFTDECLEVPLQALLVNQ